jgi:hypothetical protein
MLTKLKTYRISLGFYNLAISARRTRRVRPLARSVLGRAFRASVAN